jgi:hypothetical protein
MDTASIVLAELGGAIEAQHGGTATLAQTVPVHETFWGQVVWDGVVHVFDLEGHPTATRAYAWSSPVEGSNKRRFFAVLHAGAIKSPLDAVRAAIVAEHKSTQSNLGN